MANRKSQVADARASERRPLSGEVVLEFAAQSIAGAGENVSDDGVLLTAEGTLQVRVSLPGATEPRTGEIVRLTPMGGGRVGLAVRFHAR